jgi:hypothetical protein
MNRMEKSLTNHLRLYSSELSSPDGIFIELSEYSKMPEVYQNSSQKIMQVLAVFMMLPAV